MARGIIIFGANGSGKTTLGRELAHVLNYIHIDVEDYYFEESEIPYSKSRTKDEVIQLILADIEKYGSFVFSGVTGDYGKEIVNMYELAVFLTAPIEIRMERIEQRSEEKYGERVLLGGDMYEQEQRFAQFVKNRNLSAIDDWAKTLTCPIINIDGTKTIPESIQFILEHYN